MPYSSEVVQRARNRLAQAKEDRESENRQHLAEAYARVPRIKEIDMLLRRTMDASSLSGPFSCKRIKVCAMALRLCFFAQRS